MYYPCMAPRRMLPGPLLLPCGLIILFALVPIVLAAVGIKLTPWPGMLMLSILLLVIALVPIVFMAVGIKLTRTPTLIGVVA
jgi:hypothetical protein